MSYIRLNSLAALVIGVLAVPGAVAQNVVFQNSTNSTTGQPYAIRLGSGSVTVAPNGDVRANCVLDGASGRCTGFPTGGTTPVANAPNVSLASDALDEDAAAAGVQVRVDKPFNLSATLGNSPESCLRSSFPAVASWDGAVVPGLTNASVSLSQAVDYTFTLKCFNAAGAGSGSVTLTGVAGVGGAPPPAPGGEPAACAGFRPSNLSRLTYVTVYNTNGSSLGLRDVTSLRSLYAGTVTTARHYIEAGGGQYYAFAFNGTELAADTSSSSYSPGGQLQTGKQNAGFGYMTVSKCMGDFRLPAEVPAGDPYRVSPACASNLTLGLTDNMVNFLHEANPVPTQFECRLDLASTYYLNVVFADPRAGFPGSCNDGATVCGTKFDVY